MVAINARGIATGRASDRRDDEEEEVVVVVVDMLHLAWPGWDELRGYWVAGW